MKKNSSKWLLPSILILFVTLFQTLFAWDRVYLATYPRSGNHWVRYLIEETTHIATSSVYCDPDPPHMPNPFPWGYCVKKGYEGKCRLPKKNETVVIKTHYPALDRGPFDKKVRHHTIVIVRHPLESIYSYYLYIHNMNNIPLPSEQIPTDLLINFLQSWRRFHEYWLKKDNVLWIRYEDLYNSLEPNFKKIMKSLNYHFNNEDIKRAIAKYPPTGGLRKYQSKYSTESIDFINNELSDLMLHFNYQ